MNPFRGCHADLKNESKAFIYEHNVLFDRDKTAIISYRAKEANYVIPDSVISIGGFAFSECNSLTSIIIPDSDKMMLATSNSDGKATKEKGAKPMKIAYFFGSLKRNRQIFISRNLIPKNF